MHATMRVNNSKQPCAASVVHANNGTRCCNVTNHHSLKKELGRNAHSWDRHNRRSYQGASDSIAAANHG
jgi:hypothetical protein